MRFKVQPQPAVVQVVDVGSWCWSTRGSSGGSVDYWRGRQMLEFFFNGCDVGINGLIEQAGLRRVELLVASAKLPTI